MKTAPTNQFRGGFRVCVPKLHILIQDLVRTTLTTVILNSIQDLFESETIIDSDMPIRTSHSLTKPERS